MKKPLNLGFLDFLTLEKRRHFCEEEVRLNRRLSEDAYEGVVIVSERDGRFVLRGRVPYLVSTEDRTPEESAAEVLDHLRARLALG
jgi:aminoglycoside phosphotransferase family enzyme